MGIFSKKTDCKLKAKGTYVLWQSLEKIIKKIGDGGSWGLIWLNPSNHLCPQYLDYSAILVQLRNNYDISTVKNAQPLKAFHKKIKIIWCCWPRIHKKSDEVKIIKIPKLTQHKTNIQHVLFRSSLQEKWNIN